jgi:Na+/H+-dicarboxylate symporter
MVIVVPLVILSMITGITNLGDIRRIGKIGKSTIIYYLVTTGLSVLTGLILVNIITPGKGILKGDFYPNKKYTLSKDYSKLFN